MNVLPCVHGKVNERTTFWRQMMDNATGRPNPTVIWLLFSPQSVFRTCILNSQRPRGFFHSYEVGPVASNQCCHTHVNKVQNQHFQCVDCEVLDRSLCNFEQAETLARQHFNEIEISHAFLLSLSRTMGRSNQVLSSLPRSRTSFQACHSF